VIDSYALLNLWYPGSFPPEERFKIDKPEFSDGLWSAKLPLRILVCILIRSGNGSGSARFREFPYRELVKIFVSAGSRSTIGLKAESFDKRPVFALTLELSWRS
jgi:hypothetical protein